MPLRIFVSLQSFLASGQVCAWRALVLHDCGTIVHGFAFTIVERSSSALLSRFVDRSSTVLSSRLWNDRPRRCFHDCGSMSNSKESSYKKAAAWRTKYFTGRRNLLPGLVGFDISNRGGNPPNGDRCVDLLKKSWGVTTPRKGTTRAFVLRRHQGRVRYRDSTP